MKKKLFLAITAVLFSFSGPQAIAQGMQTQVTQTQGMEKMYPHAVIDCTKPDATFHSGWASHPHKNYVPVGFYMVWTVIAEPGTKVEFGFVVKKDQDSGGDDGKAESPFEGQENPFTKTISQNGEKISSNAVIDRAAGAKYGYKITCKLKDGTEKTIDPIIDVPPKGVH